MRMNRLLPLALITLLLVAPRAHGARGFSFGVTAGEVTAKWAILWGKANKSGTYAVSGRAQQARLTRDHAGSTVRARKSGTTTRSRSGSRACKPGTRYWFRFSRGRAGGATRAPS